MLECAGGQQTASADRPGASSQSACPTDQPQRFELEQHLVRAMIRIDQFGIEPEFRLFGSLIGVRNAGTLLYLALARGLVEPLAIAPFAFLKAGRDMALGKGA